MTRAGTVLATAVIAALTSGCHATIVYEGKKPIAIEGAAPAKPQKIPERAKRVTLTDKKIEINEKIQFGLDNATILSESFGLLDEVADVMKEHPEIKKVAIEGHASADGDDQHNLVLSDARAKAVMAYLVGKGVEQKRLTAEGFGEKRPIADNNTEVGRVKNRRVEFNIVERATSTADRLKGVTK